MKKIQYLIGALSLGLLISLGPSLLWKSLFPQLEAVTVPVTFSDGSVLTAAQLNSNNNTMYNGFNAHDHDGGNGEPSTLNFSANDTAFTQSADITFDAAGASLECDGTTAANVLIDQDNNDILVGDGTNTGAERIQINSGSGDSVLQLKVNDLSANMWEMANDNSENDILKFSYNGTQIVNYLANTTTGGITLGGSLDTATPNGSVLYSDTIIKAWAILDPGSSTVTKGVNISAVSSAGVVTFRRAMANANYAVTCNSDATGNDGIVTITATGTANFTIKDGVGDNFANGLAIRCIVVGEN